MKAIVYSKYGPPDVLQCAEMGKPDAGENEVLLKVRAASVNPVDWHFMRGTPYLIRVAAGLFTPKETRLGIDVAGQVEAVGARVTQFKPGDEVFGACRGAFAEYGCAPASALALKPANITFEQAASVCVAGLTALQGLRDKGQIQPGHKVLINGAAGGVGTFAVQLAKWFGADVSGVCSARNADLVRSIGADRIIDYNQEDFTKSLQRYDLIFDCMGNHSLLAYTRILTSKGRYVAAGGPVGKWMVGALAGAMIAPLLSLLVSRQLATFMMRRSQGDLIIMSQLMTAGRVTPVIDRRYTLKEVPEAIRYLEEGHARGKVVIAV
jgi:NADPH:quinone reductase-like Zn-dependent oxidoreductase